MQGIAQRVEQRTSLTTTVRDVQRVLSAVLANPDFWGVVSLADRPFNQVAETVKAMEESGWVAFREGRVFVTDKGLEKARRTGTLPRTLHRCSVCEGRGTSLDHFADVFRRFERVARERPEPIEQYDQAYVTPSSTMARIAIMADRGDLEGRRLLVLGDDDLVGLAAAMTKLPSRVTVVEVDERFTGFMARVAESLGVELEVVAHDLREPLPEEWRGEFDTFFTDPPDTVPGLELFIARGLSAMAGPGCAGYFGMTLIESALPKWRELQGILIGKYGVAVTDIIDDFSTYVNWDYLLESIRGDVEPAMTRPSQPWYKSALYRIETLVDSQVVEGDLADKPGLYVGPESLLWTRG